MGGLRTRRRCAPRLRHPRRRHKMRLCAAAPFVSGADCSGRRAGCPPSSPRRRSPPPVHPALDRRCPFPPPPIRASACTCAASRYEGCRRDDGLFDIEAHLADVKDHDYELLTGVRPAGEPVHDMWVRVTIDRDVRHPRDRGRHRPHALPRRLRSHRPGVREARRREPRCRASASALHDAMGGVRGCTHMTELLAYPADRAVQTFAGLRARGSSGDEASRSSSTAATRSRPRPTTVRRYYPQVVSRRRLTRDRRGAHVKIHEYQGKEIFRKYGMPDAARHPRVHRRRGGEGRASRSAARSGSSRRRSTPAAAARAAASRSRKSLDEVRELAGEILGMQLVTHQTGPGGPEGAPAADRGGRRHPQGALRRHGRRPRHAARRADGELRGRHGHRGGRRARRRRRSTRCSSTRRRA